MNKLIRLMIALAAFSVTGLLAQTPTPAPSPEASATVAKHKHSKKDASPSASGGQRKWGRVLKGVLPKTVQVSSDEFVRVI
jgi:hypothetical protein